MKYYELIPEIKSIVKSFSFYDETQIAKFLWGGETIKRNELLNLALLKLMYSGKNIILCVYTQLYPFDVSTTVIDNIEEFNEFKVFRNKIIHPNGSVLYFHNFNNNPAEYFFGQDITFFHEAQHMDCEFLEQMRPKITISGKQTWFSMECFPSDHLSVESGYLRDCHIKKSL